MTRDELLALLLVERFSPRPPTVAAMPQATPPQVGQARLFQATREAERERCMGCGTLVQADSPCRQCGASRALVVRRAKLRKGAAS